MKDTKPLRDILAEYNSDPMKADLIAVARKRLAVYLKRVGARIENHPKERLEDVLIIRARGARLIKPPNISFK